MSLCDLVAASLLAAPKLREGGCEANALPTSRSDCQSRRDARKSAGGEATGNRIGVRRARTGRWRLDVGLFMYDSIAPLGLMFPTICYRSFARPANLRPDPLGVFSLLFAIWGWGLDLGSCV
jgi:hypothetical protein